MNTAKILKKRVLTLLPEQFEDLAMDIFRYQAKANEVYQRYLQCLGIEEDSIKNTQQIPFLPIEFFKTKHILSGGVSPKIIFESSGTTGQNTSQHAVADPDFYLQLSQQIFERLYGSLKNFHILALLPSYLERKNSSLVYMVEHFIKESGSNFSGFYLNDTQALVETLRRINGEWEKIKEQERDLILNSQFSILNSKVLLIGVTFALLDLAESSLDLSFLKDLDIIVMETGGMKGRRKELLREEVHEILTGAFGVKTIHSEYGMTELLSQGYSKGEGVFELPVSMKVLLREVNDPFTLLKQHNKTGGINVIDLGNIDSCSFIETKDLGVYLPNNQGFKIIGRFDNSDIRGCNLMIQ